MKLNEQIKEIPIFHKGKRVAIIPALSHAEAKKEWIRMHPEFDENEVHTHVHKESLDENIVKKVWNDIKPEPGEKLRDVVSHFNPIPTSKEGLKQVVRDTLKAGKKVIDITTNPVKAAKSSIKENVNLEREHIKKLLADKHDLNVKGIYRNRILVNNAHDKDQIKRAHATLKHEGFPDYRIWQEDNTGEAWNKGKDTQAGSFAGD